MKRIALLVCVLLAAAVLPAVVTRADETLTNASIIDLQKLGLGDAVIIQKIKASHCNFDTSTDGLKQLKGAGVSDAVIGAMIEAGAPAPATAGVPAPPPPPGDPNDPLSAHESGIWLFDQEDGKPVMTKIETSVFSDTKAGIAFFAAYGQESKTRAVIDGAHAHVQVHTGAPTFYFYFDKTTQSLSEGSSEAVSPEEFTLSAMTVREKKDERSIVIGKAGVYGGVRSGYDKKAIRPTTYDRISPGVYKVTPASPLSDGEYCFVYSGERALVGFGVTGGGPGKAFCFGISGSGVPGKK